MFDILVRDVARAIIRDVVQRLVATTVILIAVVTTQPAQPPPDLADPEINPQPLPTFPVCPSRGVEATDLLPGLAPGLS